MKTRLRFFLFLMLALLGLACALPGMGSLPGSDSDNTPAPAARGFCGDGLCNGPENHRSCPQDCAEGEHGQSGPRGPRGQQSTPQAQVTPQPTAAAASPGEVTYAAINAYVTLDRDAGFGTCGQDPWRSSMCTNGANWWGFHIKVASISNVLVIPDGENRWVLTSHPDVLAAYGYNPDDFKPNGYYQEAEFTDFAGDDECHAQIRGNTFEAMPLATYENGQFVITFSFTTQPEEHVSGACASANFDWQLHNLRYGWGAAISGDLYDMIAILTEADHHGPGKYEHVFQVDTNPSPENRDHVTAKIEVICLTPAPDLPFGNFNKTPCPWEK